MKTSVSRLLTGVFALALLLAVGLSAQSTAQAQSVGPTNICSNDNAGCNIVKFGDHDGDDDEDSPSAHQYYTGTAGSGTAVANTDVTATNYDNVFTFVHNADGDLVVRNLNLPTVVSRNAGTDGIAGNADDFDNPDANPKTIDFAASTGTITFVAVHRSSGLTDQISDNRYQVKAFNGHSIQVSFTPETGGTFATIKTVNVDNGRPILVSTSPEPGLIVKGNTSITFSADITDGGAGFDSKFTSDNEANNNGLDFDLSNAGILTLDGGTLAAPGADANTYTKEGGVRLVVAGNVVDLVASDFTKIDGGWRVSKTLDSSSVQSIGANVPWYFEARDRANNSQRTSGAISGTAGTGTGAGTDGDVTEIVHSRFVGTLDTSAFLGSSIRVSRRDGGTTVVSNAQSITSFADGTFNIANSALDPLFNDAVASVAANAWTATYQCRFDPRDPVITDPNDGVVGNLNTGAYEAAIHGADDNSPAAQLAACDPMPGDSYEILGSNLLTIDSKSPRLQDGGIATGIVWNSANRERRFGLQGRANSIEVMFADDGRLGTTDTGGPDNAGSGLDAGTVTPAAFSVSDNTVNSVLVVGNNVYLTLEDNLASDERPTVNIASGIIMDKAGNAFGGARIDKATDRLGPVLSLSEDADLSNSKVTLTISTDEQLGVIPSVTLSRVINSDGGVAGPTAMVCDATETPANDLAAVPAAGCGSLDVADDTGTSEVNEGRTYSAADDPRRPSSQPNPLQAAALSFSYAANTNVVNPTGETGGKYNVYVVGEDTNDPLNQGKVGHSNDANNSAAFTFQLDTVLNDGVAPVVTVSDAEGTADSSDAPDVEAISPMIVTVDWAGEGSEYSGDSYRTVTLTSASLKVTFADGSSEDRTFDLATEVSTQNSIKYTIPLLNPTVGSYTLTVQGMDSAGNVRIDGTGTTVQSMSATWNVVAAKPVDVALKPGWNLISLPFQPSNPAINSVIPADHPIGLVMTYDSVQGVWLFSRRDAETGLFTGDVAAMTATSAYFVNTDSFEALKLFRPPIATAVAAPAQPPAIQVVAGWNLVPVASTAVPTPKGQDADTYFGTLGASWLRALAWDPLGRTWIAVSRDQVAHTFEATPTDDYIDRCGTTHDHVAPATGAGGGVVKTAVGAQVCVGEGLWLWVTEDGTLIPG